MRKVKFKRFIPAVIEKVPSVSGIGLIDKRKEGTGIFENDFNSTGFFHEWGSTYEEFEDGIGNFTVALVETSEGTIEEVLPKHLKFV